MTGIAQFEGQKCETCVFWLEGDCRLSAPRVVSAGIDCETLWPVTGCDEWCGSWRGKREKTAGEKYRPGDA